MHGRFREADELSRIVIGAAIEVHRALGPGLLESIYERCLAHELKLRGLEVECQRTVRIQYKGLVFDECLRFDLLVNGCLLLEIKAAQEIIPIHKAQLLTYMHLLDVPLGLILNFHEPLMIDGVHRLLLPGANIPD